MFVFQSYIWILTEVMDTSLDRFYAKLFALELTMTELFISKVNFFFQINKKFHVRHLCH